MHDASTSLAHLSIKELLALVSAGIYPEASLEYAYRLLHGIGLTHDAEACVHQFHAAAELGSAEAMYNLSVCYFRGLGVRPNLALSRYWAMRCERGHAADESDVSSTERSGARAAQERDPAPRFGSRVALDIE